MWTSRHLAEEVCVTGSVGVLGECGGDRVRVIAVCDKDTGDQITRCKTIVANHLHLVVLDELGMRVERHISDSGQALP